MAEAMAAASIPSELLGFHAIPTSTEDNILIPKGYKVSPLISWGEPILANGPEFDPSGKAPASAQEMQFGDNTDGMRLFP